MNDTTLSVAPATRHTSASNHVVDVIFVVMVTGTAYFLEGFADSQGWINVGEDARGASAMVCGALAAIAVILMRGGSLTDIGFKRPKRWALVPLQALAVLFAFLVVQAIVPLLLAQVFTLPEPDFSRHAGVTGNMGAAIFMALVLPITASIPEEVIFRGFLIERFSKVFGGDRFAAWMSVGVQALVFGSIHFEWGVGGMVFTFIMGLVWGAAFLLCDRNLWVVIFAHSAGHLLFVTQLYLGQSFIG